MVTAMINYYQMVTKGVENMAAVNIDNVKAFMEKKNLTGQKMASSMNISYSYLFRVLNGDREAGGKFIQGLINAGMSPKDIFVVKVLPKVNTGTDG
jgi:transcriptional regulator with XRE-family HTH domain